LRSAGLEEKTLIFFLSDNGGPTMPTTTINGSRNDPLRGSKRTTLEGGIRVPFLVQRKGKLPGGKVYDPPIIQLDILPTALAAATLAALKQTRPNVLIVLTDDQGLGDFSFTGNPVLKTPNFDKFAREAVRFTDFHVAPMCTPTRGRLMSGQDAVRNGATSFTA